MESRFGTQGSCHSYRNRPLPKEDRVFADHSLTCAAEVQQSSIAVARDRHIARIEGIKARGRDYAFIKRPSGHVLDSSMDGGIPLAPLLGAINAPMTATEVIARWSRVLPPQEALEILKWVWSESLIVRAAAP